MNPEANQRVKIYFRNGIIEEGVVVSWGPDKSVIKALTSDNVLVIQHTSEDVFIVKIYFEDPISAKDVYVEPEVPIVLATEPEELRTKKLVELYKQKAEIERERAREALTTFESSGGADLNTYELPRKLQKRPPIKAL